MKKICFLFLLVALTAPALADDIAGFSSYYKDQRYDVRVLSEKIEAAPKWEEKDPNPPLSAQKARTLGTQALRELFPDARSEWHLSSISLHTLYEDGWIYCVQFNRSLPKGVDHGSPGQMQIIIYMDGTVAKPDLSKPSEH